MQQTIYSFKKEIFGWAQEINVTPKEIQFRHMKNKWESCSSNGRLTFSFDVLRRSTEERANIIVHELLHLKYPNHDKMFTSLLKTYLSKKNIKYNPILQNPNFY